MFTKAIVRTPCRNIVNGLTTANIGIPDFNQTLNQHQNYIDSLKKCGLEVIVLRADEDFPDSVFIEDVALLTADCAVITNPGAPSRKGEIIGMREILINYYSEIETIKPPGTVEAGDIIMIGNHFYIGLSRRTNPEGASQVIDILNRYGMSASIITLQKVLHLKSGLAYLENNNLLASGEFLLKREFRKFNILKVIDKEDYAANCVWINGIVMIPDGYPETKKMIETAGYSTIETDVSEFQKLNGGISCLSLRF